MKGKLFWAYYSELFELAYEKNINSFIFEFRKSHYLVDKKGDIFQKPKKITKL